MVGTHVAAASYAVEHTVEGNVSLSSGTIVVTHADSLVRSAGQNDGQYVLGVVAPVVPESLPPNQVGIVSSGVTPVLVSDINGQIKSGDAVAVSPISGVGMKATSSGWILGIAQADFNPKADGIVQQQVKTADGESKTFLVQRIPVLVAMFYYNPSGQKSGAASDIQDAVQVAVGHPVSSTRAILALIVFSIAVILLVVLVYSAVRNSLMAIGRNPLASGRINAGLIKVLLTATVVIVFTLAAIYLILG